MGGFEYLVFFAYLGVLSILVVFTLKESRQNMYKQLWKCLPQSRFIVEPEVLLSGVSAADAMNVLRLLSNSGGVLPASHHNLKWQCNVDSFDDQKLETSIHFGRNLLGFSSGRYNKIWLRWRIEAGMETKVSAEWASESNEPLNLSEELVLKQVIEEGKRRLLEYSHNYQLEQTRAKSPPALPLRAAKPKTQMPDLVDLSAWVKIPDRVYEKIEPEKAVEILHDFISKGGILKEPISGHSYLCWKGSCLSDPIQAFLIETPVKFSHYSENTEDALLDQELVMSWRFKEKQLAVSNRPGLKISCQWKGPFQQSSGDIIRFLLSKMDFELVNAGASAVLQAGMQVRSRAASRSRHELWVKISHGAPPAEKNAFWPSLQDYNESIQNLETSFDDEELRKGTLELNVLGLPRVATGAFASVYRVRCGERDYAIRCFNTAIKDQEERYQKTSRFICSDDLSYTVPLFYIEKGIRVKGQWFPILKMEWVNGTPLYDYIEENLNDSGKLLDLQKKFLIMMNELKQAGIAHSDLQHGNIIISADEFVLVDYDGMFVPELSGFFSNERGHPNYQHPQREGTHFGPYLDNFSAWVIDSALFCLERDPGLWQLFAGDGESLMFKRKDFEMPAESALFAALRKHEIKEIRVRADYLLYLLKAPVDRIPYLAGTPQELLSPDLSTVDNKKELESAIEKHEEEKSSKPGQNVTSGLPDWMS